MNRRNWGSLAFVLIALPMVAQVQTGSMSGKVTAKDGKGLAGVRIDVTANVLPQPRRMVTNDAGEYRLPFLPPGEYVLTYSHPDKAAQKRAASVMLSQNTTLNVTLPDVAGAQVEVVADKAALMDATSSEIKSSFSADVINSLPVGQNYRDLIKLIPGVTYSQDAVRAPSAGGSGQDNVHKFDGVNVNLPMYGTMSSQPSGHDIDQVTVIKAGADATGFNRSAGYTINSLSKSGTNAFTGDVSYMILPDTLVEKRRGTSAVVYEQRKTYSNVNVGGPILRDRLFFFASIYRPTVSQVNSANLYGTIPDYSSITNEYFGKLTWAPLTNLLVHASYRKSDQTYQHSGYGSAAAPTVGIGGKGTFNIGVVEAVWNVTPNSYINFKTTNFINKSNDNPDYRSPAVASFASNATLNINDLATQGAFTVPSFQGGTTPNATQQAYNTFITPIVNKYGYISPTTGLPTGGGIVGGTSSINNQDFYRRNHELSYDAVWGSTITHNFHVGVQWFKEMEDLNRYSNGWGSVTVPYNTFVPTGFNGAGQQIFYAAAVNQQGVLNIPTIHSEFVSTNYEINDKIRWRNFTFNVGLVLSNDKFYGSGLQPAATVSGYVLARGNKYLEHEVKISDTLQPRIGVIWNYHAEDTIYANYGRFVPSVSSLSRASSWDRNLISTVNVWFDQNGRILDHQTENSSTGKFWSEGLKPRHTDEFLVGTTRDLGKGWSGRLYGRYRHSVNFWEDTDNGARVMFATPAGIPKTYYIPNLYQMLNQLYGTSLTQADTNSSFVIAQLDDSFTKYYEVGLETEWKGSDAYLNLSYSWSHYYGNFDQDNSTTTTSNDSNIFVGSSNIADDFGRQLWNNKYGNLTGDRRHKLKVFGSYNLPWSAQVGIYYIYQSGQPWQYTDYKAFLADRAAQGSTSTSDVNRYAEPAGSRTTPPHQQWDLSYTQTFWKTKRYRLEGMANIYNLLNRQTGYYYVTSLNSSLVGQPSRYFDPRRLQLGARFVF